MKLSEAFSSMPLKGDTWWEFKGGPLDNQGWWIDLDIAPSQLIADGHCYNRVVRTLREITGEDTREKYLNDPDEPFDFDYIYAGKQT